MKKRTKSSKPKNMDKITAILWFVTCGLSIPTITFWALAEHNYWYFFFYALSIVFLLLGLYYLKKSKKFTSI